MLALLTLSSLLLNQCYSAIIEHNPIGVIEHATDMHDNNNTRGPEDLVRRLLPGGFSAQDKVKILQTHNRYRTLTAQGMTQGQPSASNMNQLLWDDGLAKVAQDYSAKCTWAHNSNRVNDMTNNADLASFDYTSRQPVGENLFLSSGTESIDTILQGIQYWYSEYTYYTYGTLAMSGSCKSGQQCGHYTQLVWGNTRYVGCGYTKCPSVSGGFNNAVLFVCNYYFAGNIVGSYPYKAGSYGTACGSDRNPQNGLCSGCPNPSWDTYCCEYCSSSSCLNAKASNLLGSPSSCTDGVGNNLSGSGPIPTPKPTTPPTVRKTNPPTSKSPTAKPIGSPPKQEQAASNDGCCSAINSRYKFFCQSVNQEQSCRIYPEVCVWDDDC